MYPYYVKKEITGFDPENLTPDDQLKFEIASELGLADKVKKRRLEITDGQRKREDRRADGAKKER